ncbi:alpha-1,4-glucan--maltose-1-phosphate maltosyltransferase [soil metagenome]
MIGKDTLMWDRQAPPSSIIIENVSPSVDCGRYAAKRESGDLLEVTADIFKDGHDRIAADLLLRKCGDDQWLRTPMTFVDNDRWSGSLPVGEPGAYEFAIEAVADLWLSWLEDTEKKAAAGLDIELELRDAKILLEAALARTAGNPLIERAVSYLERIADTDQNETLELLSFDALGEAMREAADRSSMATLDAPRPLWVDRVAARYAAWYSMFPRSAGRIPGQSGTFQDVIDQLPRISGMGFDVLYFTPIHPIGYAKRKGKNNSVESLPDDPGVPYAIGNDLGGHDAIEPSLGTVEDFERLVSASRAYGMEIALDLAINASPDHPWVRDHPEWFTIRADGSIQFSENPPKKYQDIYPINFQTPAWKELWIEQKRIVSHWIDLGVKTFRVDNPHTKPTVFWEWLIDDIHQDHPEVIFLSEAFTRPKVMKSLAKAGFAQSYTYFTWRIGKQELTEYFTELTNTDVADYMRGNVFTNTHDINPFHLQTGGRAGFKIRHVLASTLSSVYGIYNGFELCEATPVPGREEYLNSEKYEYKVWDWDRPGNITADITLVNRIRKNHPALHEYDNLRFFWAEGDDLLCYGKSTPDHSDNILIVVNLNPRETRSGRIWFDPAAFGFGPNQPIVANDLISGQQWTWQGGDQWIRLDPSQESAHIFQLSPG